MVELKFKKFRRKPIERCAAHVILNVFYLKHFEFISERITHFLPENT